MISIVTALITVCGSAGFGSVLKVISGIFDSWQANKELNAKALLAATLQQNTLDVEFQKALFSGEDNKYARQTRRIIAVVSVFIFGFIMIWACLHPEQRIVTLTSPEAAKGSSFLWGLIQFSKDVPMTIEITMGHLILVGLSMIGLIFGFYFTPGGRK